MHGSPSEVNDVLVSEAKGNTRQALNDVKNSGMQKQCYPGIKTFFTEPLTDMQKSLALRNPLIEALTSSPC